MGTVGKLVRGGINHVKGLLPFLEVLTRLLTTNFRSPAQHHNPDALARGTDRKCAADKNQDPRLTLFAPLPGLAS